MKYKFLLILIAVLCAVVLNLLAARETVIVLWEIQLGINVVILVSISFLLQNIYTPFARLIKNQNSAANKVSTDKEALFLSRVIDDLKNEISTATHFIKSIQDYKESGEKSVSTLRQEVLSQSQLLQSCMDLKKNLIEIFEKERIRNWTADGYAKFMEILRSNGENQESLHRNILSSMIKFVAATYGALYILNEDDDSDPYLHLVASYAGDGITKRRELGEGLLGQCVDQKETIFLNDVPDNFLKINSGLGEAPPSCILIVPFKINQKVCAVVEMAAFIKFEEYQIAFIENIGESVASTIYSARMNKNKEVLLDTSRRATEELKAQEEELKQNLEELQAIQESQRRIQDELMSKSEELEKANEKNKAKTRQFKEAMEKLDFELETKNSEIIKLRNELKSLMSKEELN